MSIGFLREQKKQLQEDLEIDDQIKGKWQKESYESKRNRGRYREGDGKEKEKERDEAISQLDIILGL